MPATLTFTPRFLIGDGAISQIGELLTRLGSHRPVIVTDAFMATTSAIQDLVAAVRQPGIEPGMWSGVVPDPTTTSLDAGLQVIAEHDGDAIIAIGGGSPIDTAKALAVLAVRGGSMRELKAPNVYNGPALPVIAIPTTAGTGSEATRFTIITDSSTDEKMLCTGDSFLPAAAVIDVALTATMPPRLTADTGIDALTHAVEAYVSIKANPFTDQLALAAITAIGKHLRRAYTDGSDREARSQMMAASTLAGMAFSNSSVALVHGMSRPIGAHFHVAHGLANAMLFPAVTAFSIDAAEARYADCARAFGVAEEADNDDAAARKLVDALGELCVDLDVPTPERFGIDRDAWEAQVPTMAAQALASGSPANNPRVPTADEIAALYREIFA